MKKEGKQNFKPASAKLIFVFIVSILVILIAAVIAIIFILDKNKEQEASIMDEQHLMDMVGQTVENNIIYLVDDIATIKNYIENERLLASSSDLKINHLSDDLKAIAEIKFLYKKFLVTDKSGQAVLSLINGPNGFTAEPDSDKSTDPNLSKFINQILKSEDNIVYISDIKLYRNNGQIALPIEPTLMLGTPIVNQDKTVAGVIVTTYNISAIIESATSVAMHNKRVIELLNGNGYWLKSKNSENDWGFEFPDRKEKNLKNIKPSLWKKLNSQENGYIFDGDENYFFTKIDLAVSLNDNETKLGKYNHKILVKPNEHWYAFSRVPKSEIYINSYSLLNDMLIIGIIMTMIMSVVVGYAAGAIAKRQKAEEQVFQLNDVLKIFNKILRHDLNGKFTAIRLSMENYLANDNKEYLNIINESTLSGIELINQMKKLETLASAGNNRLVKIGLAKVLNEVAPEYQIPIKITGDGYVMADEVLRSVFDNIIRNAIMHGFTEKIDIVINQEKNLVRIKIIDYGNGVPEDIREKIFEEGFKYGETGNTGLGLYIVKKTIERYKGKIFVESNQPRGAIFVIELPSAK